MTGQAGHGHDIAGKRDDKARTGGKPDLADRNPEAGRSSDPGWIVSQRILCLRHANRNPVKAGGFQIPDRLLRGVRKIDAVGPVHATRDCAYLFGNRAFNVVQEPEIHGLRGCLPDLAGQFDATVATLRPHLGQGNLNTYFPAF